MLEKIKENVKVYPFVDQDLKMSESFVLEAIFELVGFLLCWTAL